jgi:hypothetical protein
MSTALVVGWGAVVGAVAVEVGGAGLRLAQAVRIETIAARDAARMLIFIVVLQKSSVGLLSLGVAIEKKARNCHRRACYSQRRSI